MNMHGSCDSYCSRLFKNERVLYFAERLFSWIALALAIVSGSAIGPVFKYMEQKHVPPCLSAAWRSMTMMIFLLPLAAIENYNIRVSGSLPIEWFKVNRSSPMPFSPAVHMLISGIGWTGNLLCWIEGLEYTNTVRASVFANVHPLMLVFVLRFFMNKNVSWLEWGGVWIVMGGIAVSAYRKALQQYDLDKKFERRHMHDENSQHGNMVWFGDFLCLIAAASEMIVLLDRMKTKSHIPLLQYTTATTLVVTVSSIILSLLFERGPGGGGIGVFCHSEYCLMGWSNPEWVGPMLLFGLFIGVICMAGYNYSVQYISPLLFSSLTLLEPAVTGLLSWVAHVEGIPDTATIVGSCIVIMGVWLISIGEHRREKHEESELDCEMEVVDFSQLDTSDHRKSNFNVDSQNDSLLSKLSAAGNNIWNRITVRQSARFTVNRLRPFSRRHQNSRISSIYSILEGGEDEEDRHNGDSEISANSGNRAMENINPLVMSISLTPMRTQPNIRSHV